MVARDGLNRFYSYRSLNFNVTCPESRFLFTGFDSAVIVSLLPEGSTMVVVDEVARVFPHESDHRGTQSVVITP